MVTLKMQRYRAPPPPRRRTKTGCGCTCDCNYARSLQGICKVIQLFLLGLAWIIIAASPYWRPIFVIGGQTWPFHVVMLISVLAWLATLFMYCLFMSGYHLSQGHRNWPKIEFWFNVVMAIMVLTAAAVEAANVWRFDMSRGSVMSGSSSYSNYYQYGLRPGMSFTQTLNFNSYCSTRPRDCTDYFNLLAGNNSYYTNHLFGVVLLFFALIAYLVSVYFAYKTWKVFERDMYKPGELPKPSIWMRLQYQMEQATNHVRDKANKVLKRNNDAGDDVEDDEDDLQVQVVVEETKTEKPLYDVEAGYDRHTSSRSEGRESRARSHSSHHTSRSHDRSHGDHRSQKSRSSHRHEENGRSSHSSTGHRSRLSKAKSPDGEAPPPYPYKDVALVHAQPVGALHPVSQKKHSKKGKKEGNTQVDMSPVASVMI